MLLIYLNSKCSDIQVDKIKLLSKQHDVIVSGEKLLDPILEDMWCELTEIDPNSIDKILVVDNSQSRKLLPNKLLVSVFSIKPVHIRWLGKLGGIERRLADNVPNTLFIFPGSIIPLNMGSHQRAFNLLYNMSELGIRFDVLITSNSKLDKLALTSALEAFADNVYFYKNKAKKFKRVSNFKRGLEKRIRILLGKDGNLPDLFSERAYRKPTESLKRWVNSLFLMKNYENIIVSYAWLIDAVQYIQHEKRKFNLICDTHDVQFYRNENILNRKERLFFNYAQEKRLEISLLNKCDYVLSISDADRKILQKNIKSQVIAVYPGFDYAKNIVKQRPVGRPVHFGFIGGGMSANVVALRYIIEKWWPVIKRHSPDSILYVAGSICNNATIKELSFFDRNIILLGFVKDIFDFYSKFEVSLNPVLVSGGLNFKSVEAVCAGKHLFTNALGKECLAEDFPCIVIDEPLELINAINQIEFDLQGDKQKRIAAQEKALSIFGNIENRKSLNGFIY